MVIICCCFWLEGAVVMEAPRTTALPPSCQVPRLWWAGGWLKLIDEEVGCEGIAAIERAIPPLPLPPPDSSRVFRSWDDEEVCETDFGRFAGVDCDV